MLHTFVKSHRDSCKESDKAHLKHADLASGIEEGEHKLSNLMKS